MVRYIKIIYKRGFILAKRVTKNYINNADFTTALVNHKAKCNEARENGTELPRVPNYIGECLQSMAYRIATKPNFSNYPFKEDMIMDGIENCIRYVETFDASRYEKPNPFAYFTRAIINAFIARIGKEKKQLYTRLKSSQMLIAQGQTYSGGEDISVYLNIDADYIDNYIKDYEDKIERDKEKKREKDRQKELDAIDKEASMKESE